MTLGARPKQSKHLLNPNLKPPIKAEIIYLTNHTNRIAQCKSAAQNQAQKKPDISAGHFKIVVVKITSRLRSDC